MSMLLYLKVKLQRSKTKTIAINLKIDPQLLLQAGTLKNTLYARFCAYTYMEEGDCYQWSHGDNILSTYTQKGGVEFKILL